MKLAEVIKFEKGKFVVAGASEAEVDAMLRQIAYETQAGYDLAETHALLAQNIVEPIRQTVPYVEMYRMFFEQRDIGDLEDAAIPIEDLPMVAWQVHRDGEVMFVRANYRWTRPEFVTFQVGIEVAWDDLRFAGWNFLARQMRYATENLARQRDAVAKQILDAAIPSAHKHTVSGGALTRAAVKNVLKQANAIGFPMTQCLVNSGTVTDMAEWIFPTGQSYEIKDDQLVTNLYLSNYGGCNFYVNPHAPTNTLYFSGPAANTGYQIRRGVLKTASDVDIRKKIDLHAFYDQDHSWYVGNAYNLRRLVITA